MPMMSVKRRKKNISRKKIIAIFAIFLLILLTYALILSPIFRIKEVFVYGNAGVNAKEIKDSVASTNILLLNSEQLENELLLKFPKISEAKIKKNIFKKTLSVTISEREDIGIACKENINKCFYFDEKGVVFEDAPQTSGSLIVSIKDFSPEELFLGKKAYAEETINMIIEIKEYLSSSTNIKTDRFEITINPPKEIKTITSKNWYILFDATKDIKKQLSILKTALDEKIKDTDNLEYIDLTIENRIYYK